MQARIKVFSDDLVVHICVSMCYGIYCICLDLQVSFLVNSRTLAALKYNIMGFDTLKTGLAVWLTQEVSSI